MSEGEGGGRARTWTRQEGEGERENCNWSLKTLFQINKFTGIRNCLLLLLLLHRCTDDYLNLNINLFALSIDVVLVLVCTGTGLTCRTG
jgi:hypothetical protein